MDEDEWTSCIEEMQDLELTNALIKAGLPITGPDRERHREVYARIWDAPTDEAWHAAADAWDAHVEAAKPTAWQAHTN